MYNQGNYQQFGQRLPPPPSSLQQGPQAYLNPLIPPPRIPPPNFYTIPPPSSYFTPASFGSLQPPPPSSPPPGPPPLPPSPPHDSSEPLFTDPELSPSSRNPFVAMNDDILNSTTVNGFEKSDIPPPKPTNETTVRMIEVLCQYIAKNGNEFEDMTCKKEVDNPEFAFLFGGPPGSEAAISHEYFKWMKKKCSSSELLNHSPASSDMDMEDDITQLYEHQTDFTSNKVDIKVEEYISHKDGNVLSRVPEGTNPITLIQDDNSENDDELHFENVSPVAGSPLIKESLNPSVVEPCLNTSSKIPELSTTTEKVKQVDEFGRLVKAGGISDSDSGDYKRRRGRSRSPSPNRKRRQSPRRRRSRSRSWSPKKRHRSRSPYRQRGEETRRNKSHYRGPTRHYIPESEKNDKNKHHYNQEVSDTKRDLVDPCEDANSVEQLVTESVTPPHIPNQISPPVPVSTNYPPSWNPLPPPPPLPQISGPLLNYQNQSTLQLNYPFFKPYATELTPLQQPYYGISTHYNPYASTFDRPLTTNFTQDTGTSYNYTQTQSQYDPLFDSIEPVVNPEVTTKQKEAADVENDEFGETGDAEVENESPGVATGEVEKNKDSRSMKLFKVSLAEFVKEVLKPSWRQGNMSKEAFKTIVKKTVDKVSGAIKKHQVPKSQAKINHYIDSSQRKLTKLVMGYVDKYVKV